MTKLFKITFFIILLFVLAYFNILEEIFGFLSIVFIFLLAVSRTNS